MQQFLIDTSALVQAQNQYYAQDIVPGFWNQLLALHGNGVLLSIDRVLDEIRDFHDATEVLRLWADNTAPADMFASTALQSITDQYSTIMTAVSTNSQYRQVAVAEFARGADGWVVAFAKVNGCVVVSMEVSAPQSQTKIKIPDVCVSVGVEHIDTYEFLRRTQATFA